MSTQDDLARLMTLAKALGNREMKILQATKFETMTDQMAAVTHVKQAYKAMTELARETAVPTDAPATTRAGWEAREATFLAAARDLMTDKIAPHMRAAKLQGLTRSAKQRGTELREMAQVATVANDVKDFVEKAETAAKNLAKLAGDPLKYYEMARDFVNNKVLKFARWAKVPVSPGMSMASTNRFLEILKANKVTAKMFQATEKVFAGIARFLGVLQAGLQAVSLVFSTAAQSGRWARTLVKGGFAIGAGLAIGALGSSAAAASAISSTLGALATAAGVTAEVPPVAVALVAAGLVVAATWAVTKLFDFMIETLFGPSRIPAKMRAMMAAPMAHSTSASMHG